MNLKSDNIVPIIPASVINFSGRINKIHDGHIHIDYAGEIIKAKKAFSCLIEPMIGDNVLLSQDQYHQAYVIAILQREHDTDMTLQLAENTRLACDKVLTFQSEQINQLSQKSWQKSTEVTMDFQQGIIKGDTLHSHIRHLHSMSDLISTLAKQAIQKFNSYVRKTESSDQVQAAHMSRKVDGLYTMNSKHTIMISQKDTKIDGEHIHMG